MRTLSLLCPAALLCAVPAFGQFDANGNPPWSATGVLPGAPGSVLSTINGPYSPCSGLGHNGVELLVISAYDGLSQIYILDDTTGATVGTAPVDSPSYFGLGWDASRSLYITTDSGGFVRTFDGVNSTPVGNFTVPGAPVGVAWDSIRDVYWVTDWRGNTVYSIDPASGAVITTYSTAAVGCTRPAGVGFDPVHDTIYVGGRDQSAIFGIDAATGTLVCSFAAQDGGNNPQGLAGETARASVWHSSWNSNLLFELEGCWGGAGLTLRKSGTCPGPMTFTAVGATPNGTVAFVWGTSGSFTIPTPRPCAGTVLALVPLLAPPPGYILAGATSTGDASVQANVPASACGQLLLQALDLTTCSTSNTITF